MAKVRGEVFTTGTVTLVLDEAEARALEALAGYGDEKFLEVFYKHLGEAYLRPHQAGLFSLFSAARGEVGQVLNAIDKRRKLNT